MDGIKIKFGWSVFFLLFFAGAKAQMDTHHMYLQKQDGNKVKKISLDRNLRFMLKDKTVFDGFILAQTDSSFFVLYGFGTMTLASPFMMSHDDSLLMWKNKYKAGRLVHLDEIRTIGVRRIKKDRVFKEESLGTALTLVSLAGPIMLVVIPIQWLVKGLNPALGLVVGTGLSGFLFTVLWLDGEHKYRLDKKWKVYRPGSIESYEQKK